MCLVQSDTNTHMAVHTGSGITAKDCWPPGLLCEVSAGGESLSDTRSLDAAERSFGDQLYVERYKTHRSDKMRQVGIYWRGPVVQEPVNLTLYGFVKTINLATGGDWRG